MAKQAEPNDFGDMMEGLDAASAVSEKNLSKEHGVEFDAPTKQTLTKGEPEDDSNSSDEEALGSGLDEPEDPLGEEADGDQWGAPEPYREEPEEALDEDEEDGDVDEDDDDEVETVGFDVNAALDEIKTLKTGNLRKHALNLKAEKLGLEQERTKLMADLEARDKRVESLERDIKTGKVASPEISLEEYAPFKELSELYQRKVTGVYNRLRSTEGRNNIRNHHAKLRTDLARIQRLTGEEYDTARDQFQSEVQDMFGEDSDKVVSFLDEAAEMEETGARIQEDFKTDHDGASRTSQRKIFDKHQRDIRDHLGSYYDVPDKTVRENPYTLRAFVAELKKGPEGQKLAKYIDADIDMVAQIQGGMEPFDPTSEKWSGMDPEAAKEQWITDYDKLQKNVASQVPELLAEGIMQRRMVPFLIRQIRELRGKRRGRGPKLSPSGKRTSAGKRKPANEKEELAQAARDVERAMDKLE